ncbi:MAG: nucleotidyltransferase family protein [Ignavibacteria bacterium]|nr:nucleotidyltransferase family protein [Ignavibacteria bacterium]
MQALIFAAGVGSRLKPITDSIPKAMVDIGGVPVIEYSIRKLMAHGFNDIVINIHHFPDQIINFLKVYHNFGANIHFSDESDLLLDTGGGLKKAKKLFHGSKPILLYNCDIVTDLNLTDFYNFHMQSKSLATVAISNRNTSRYLLFTENNLLGGWMSMDTGEIKIARTGEKVFYKKAFSGIHIINPALLKLLPRKKVFSMIDVYLSIAESQNIGGFVHDETGWIDIGKPASLERARKLNLKEYI